MKQTEIGMIPDDWEVKRLGDLSTLLTGFPFSGEQIKEHGRYRLLRGINITEGDIRHSDDIDRYFSGSIQKLDDYKLQNNDLVIGMDGSKVGKNSALIHETDVGSLLVQRVARLRSIINKSDISYIYAFINSFFFTDYVDSLKTSSAIPHISPKNIREFKISLPPTLAEQQKIAKALSDVDNVISTLEKLITKKKNLKQGTMQQLLTGKKRLPGFAKSNKFKQTEIGEIPEDCEVVQLNTLIDDISDGPFGSNLKTEHYTTEREARIIQLSNVGEDGWNDENTKYTTFTHAKELSRCIVPSGSVIIAKMMPAGRSILCPNNERMYILGSDCVKFIPNKLIDSKYFVYYTKCTAYLNQIKENTQGSTRARTSVTKLKKIQIILPSKPEQTAIANVLSSMDKEIEALNTKLEKYRNLKTGMMQQLLTGKIRLI